LDAFLVTNPLNIYYFTDYLSQSPIVLLVIVGAVPRVYLSDLELAEAQTQLHDPFEIVVPAKSSNILLELMDDLQQNHIKILGFEEDSLATRRYQLLSQACSFLVLQPSSSIITNLRRIKTHGELQLLMKASVIGGRGMDAAIASIYEGVMEYEVAAEAEYAMRKAGSTITSFDTIVASGIRSTFPHGLATRKPIERGDLITIDLGAKYRGYCSDMTRTVVLGTPTSEQLALYEMVLAVQQQAIAECKVGVKGSTLETNVRATLTKFGYEQFFIHSLGHGVGLEIAEKPWLSLYNSEVLLAQEVFTIEPGIYLPNFGGVRIEDMFVLRQRGPEVLTKAKHFFQI
jgi:Xaa-Pro aminopeptidase